MNLQIHKEQERTKRADGFAYVVDPEFLADGVLASDAWQLMYKTNGQEAKLGHEHCVGEKHMQLVVKPGGYESGRLPSSRDPALTG